MKKKPPTGYAICQKCKTGVLQARVRSSTRMEMFDDLPAPNGYVQLEQFQGEWFAYWLEDDELDNPDKIDLYRLHIC